MDDFKFSISLRVRAGDLNFGNHVGHQNYLLYFQEARIAYLDQLGFSELDIDGFATMIAEANCRYKKELFLGDTLSVGARVGRLRKKIYTMEYAILRGQTVCAEGYTAGLCLEKSAKKVVRLPQKFIDAVLNFEGIHLDS